ncbi:MAG: alpha-isopropylmalate synthase regulatory domain-containing protein [Geodermatophilaceae bacterium]
MDPRCGVDVRVLDYAEHALSAGGDATAAAYLECAVGDRVLWGVGIDPNIVTASLQGSGLGGQPRPPLMRFRPHLWTAWRTAGRTLSGDFG